MNEEAEIEREIRAYLASHPDAQDTIEGIVEWWLLKQRIQDTTVKVEKVLGELVARNVMQARRMADGRVHYRMKKRPGQPGVRGVNDL